MEIGEPDPVGKSEISSITIKYPRRKQSPQIKPHRSYPIHPILTAAVGVLSCVAVGYVASIFLPDRDRLLKNLTLATLEDAEEAQKEKGSV